MTEDEVRDILLGCHRESLAVDYKADLPPNARAEELAKYASSFANTEGGILFYGVNANSPSEAPSDFPGVESMMGRDSVATWYERKVNAVLTPHVTVESHMLREGLPVPAGRVVLAVRVPRSPVGPHMIWSNKDDKNRRNDLQYRYYVRHETESEPATEQEVRAMYGRSFGSPRLYLRPGFLPSLKWRPCVQVVNIGATAARNVRARFELGYSLDVKVNVEASLRSRGEKGDIYAGILQPGEYYSYLLTPRKYAFTETGNVMCLARFEDPYGLSYEEFMSFELRDWIEQVTLGRVWSWELGQASDNDWAEIGCWEPMLLQQRDIRRNEGPKTPEP